MGISKFDTERYLLETLERINKNKFEYKVLYINVSKLKPKNRHPKFVKIIAKLFDNFVAIANGIMFVLSNGDLVILGKNILQENIEKAIDKLRRGLVTDPIWTKYSTEEFALLYEPEDFNKLYENVKNIMESNEIDEIWNYKYPVDALQINGVKEHLDEINIKEIIKHQSVLLLKNSNKFEQMFEEFFVAVKDLSKKFDANMDLLGNKWLFLYLTEFLDKKTMYSFLFSEIKNKPKKVSLNVNISTLMSKDFDDFVNFLDENNQKLVAEVKIMDILNNMQKYFEAKDYLHKRGGEILIDEASLEMLQALDLEKLQADYIKIFWHPLMEEYIKAPENIKSIIENIGVEKFILAKTLDEKALRWGVKNGIRAFQGPYIDVFEAALIRSKCPMGKKCTLQECMKRKKLIAGEVRDLCEYKQFLESNLE